MSNLVPKKGESILLFNIHSDGTTSDGLIGKKKKRPKATAPTRTAPLPVPSYAETVDHHADEINAEHREAHKQAESAVRHAIRCGELLRAQKKRVGHGGFMAWIGKHCEFSQATANNYMKLAQNPNAVAESIRHLFPSGSPPPKLPRQNPNALGISTRAQRQSTSDSPPPPAAPIPAETAKTPLPEVAAPLPIASPEASQEVVSKPKAAETRAAHLERVKAAISEYASQYGWGAAQMDLVEWIEAQA